MGCLDILSIFGNITDQKISVSFPLSSELIKLESLPKKCQKELQEAINKTKEGNRTTLILALSYSSRWEIINAIKQIVKDDVSEKNNNEELFSQYLTTKGVPNPELLIRTSGEQRISNFLLWQIAYSELYFTNILWPEFRRENLFEAIYEFQQRERIN